MLLWWPHIFGVVICLTANGYDIRVSSVGMKDLTSNFDQLPTVSDSGHLATSVVGKPHAGTSISLKLNTGNMEVGQQIFYAIKV